MKEVAENINRVLADWNPIGVPAKIAEDEYRGYVSDILKHIIDRRELINYFEDVLVNKMGVDYNPSDKAQLRSLHELCDKIEAAYNAAHH